MDLLKEDINHIYLKYLISSMGSAIVVSIYSIVDTVAIGQSEGPNGTAAMAVVNPVWGIIVFFGILCGVGGAVLMSKAKGSRDAELACNYFSVALVVMLSITMALWLFFWVFAKDILLFFGAGEYTLGLALGYAKWLIAFFPLFTLSVFFAIFLRNDNAPDLAMAAIIAGAIFNMFGDWFFVFPLKMGIRGAAIATVLGTAIQLSILCSHFFSKKCGLKFRRPTNFTRASADILATGFSSGLIDLANAALVILFNTSIMKYSDVNALAVYGVICTCASLFQAMFSGVGQAVQPILSINYGAGKISRIDKTMRMAIATVGAMGIILTLAGCLFPKMLVKMFMEATPGVLKIAPGIIGVYFMSFLLMGFNVLATYYFQSVVQTGSSLLIALLRGIVFSGLLLIILPFLFASSGIWWAIPIAELLTVFFSCRFYLKRRNNEITPTA
jgi:Na+-driven multidrug efflux pump